MASDPAKAPQKLEQAARAQLTALEAVTLGRKRWHDRLVSGWAPVTALALVFLVYLAIVETSVCTYLWLQPLMKAVGFVCVLWWAGVLLARFVLRPWNAARAARYEADEVLAQVCAVADRHQARLSGKPWDDLVAQVAAVERAYGAPVGDLTAALKALAALDEKHLDKLRGGGAVEFANGFVKALAIALLVRAVFLEPFKIPSGSMLPTLEIGDQIFVNKFIYGVRLPFTNYVPFVVVRPPRRGDVIVFNNPVLPDKDFIKRVVGTPGDVLEFKGRDLYLNGTLVEASVEGPDAVWEQYPPRFASVADALKNWFVDDWERAEVTRLSEHLDGVPHAILYRPSGHTRDMRLTVPPGQVFVMGDNRDNSDDSRFGLGNPAGTGEVEFVPFGNIKGKATVIWLELGRGGLGSSLFGGTGFRTDRLFQPVTECPAPRP